MDFKNSCPRSQNRGRRWLGLTVMVLAMMLTILLPGCGSSGSTGGNAVAKAFQDVIFHFNNTEAEAELAAKAVPDGTASVVFTGSDDNRQVLYGPVNKPFANTIVLTEVPVATTGFVLEYLDTNGNLIGLYSVKPLNMSAYRETEVFVNDYPSIAETLSSIKVVPDTITNLAVGYDETLTATAVFKDGQILNVSRYMSYTSSDENVATVTNSVVTAIGGGSCVISGSLLGMASNDVNVTVDGGVVATSLTLSSDSLNIPAEHSRTLQAIVHFNNGTSKVISDGVWTAEPASGVVTLSASGKVCEVNAVGEVGKTAVVTATTADGALSASCDVTIIDGTLKSLAIERTDEPYEGLTENQIYSYGDGSTAQFKATATYTDGTEEDVTSSVIWNSSNTTAAKFVDATPGLLQGVTENASTDVTATLDDETSDSVTIEVVYPGIVEIKINVDSERILIYKGYTYTTTVSAIYANGTEEDITVADDTKYEFRTGSGEVSSEYVSFSKDTESGKVILTGLSETNPVGTMRVTNARASKDIYGSIPVNVTVDDVKSIVLKLKDNLGEKWYVNITDNTSIRIPMGRKYTFTVEGNTQLDPTFSDITGSCIFWDDTYRGAQVATSSETPVIFESSKDDSGASEGALTVTSYGANGGAVINEDGSEGGESEASVNWASDDLNAEPTGCMASDNGELNVRIQHGKKGDILRMSVILCRPAIDAAYNYNGYLLYDGAGTYVYSQYTEIPQGVEVTVPGSRTSPAFNNVYCAPFTNLSVQMSNFKSVDLTTGLGLISLDQLKERPGRADGSLKVNVDAYNKITFMEQISSPDDTLQCKDYTCVEPFETEGEWKFDSAVSDEDHGFGILNGGTDWKSYDMQVAINSCLAPPLIENYELDLTDMDGNSLDDKLVDGKYVLDADSYFLMKCKNASLSNGDPFDGDDEKNLLGTIIFTLTPDASGNTHVVLETLDEVDQPYKVHVTADEVGYMNNAMFAPDLHKYWNAMSVSQETVITVKSK